MADNFNFSNTGSGYIGAADSVSGVLYQRVKVVWGIDGAVADVSRSNPLPVQFAGSGYETVAASQSDQVLGATGAIGDFLIGLLVIPATTSPGAVSIKDGTGSAMTVFTGGTVADLKPFFLPINAMASTGAGGWKVTTGSNVSVFASGTFT